MPLDDGWDWEMLLYIGTVTLKRSDVAFWRMIPKRLVSLASSHIKVNNPDKNKDKQEKLGFIDQVM